MAKKEDETNWFLNAISFLIAILILGIVVYLLSYLLAAIIIIVVILYIDTHFLDGILTKLVLEILSGISEVFKSDGRK